MIGYPALFEPALEPGGEGGFVVTFPDFGYGATQGENEAEATAMASDLLVRLISDCIEAGKALPSAGIYRDRKYRTIQPPALAAIKSEFYRAFVASGIRKSDLAARLGIAKTNVDRLFNLGHSSRIDHLDAAFRAVGKEMSIEVRDAA